MTGAVLAEDVTEPSGRPRGCFRDGTRRAWQFPGEPPGKPGDPEIWIDESAMDSYGRGDAEPAVTVTRPGGPDDGGPAGNWWVGASIRFARRGNDPGMPFVYQVISRCWSRENDGRPYYVCVRPD